SGGCEASTTCTNRTSVKWPRWGGSRPRAEPSRVDAMIPPSVVDGERAPGKGAEPPIIFVIFQSGLHANGGVESISHIVHHLRGFRPIIVTQSETRMTKRWRDAGWEVHVWRGPDSF